MHNIIIPALLIMIVLLLGYIRKLETTTELKRYYEKKINELKKDPYKYMNELRIEKNKEIAEVRIEKNKEVVDIRIQKNKEMQSLKDELKRLQGEYNQGIKTPMKNALISSRKSFKREFGEIFCPFQNGFSYNVRDCKFIGHPIDYIIFNNLEAYREGEKEIDDIEIIFIEVKTTHSANLSKVQKAIEYAISNKRVKFKTYKYDEDTINKAQATLIDKYM